MADNCSKWLVTAGNGLKWLEMVGNDRKWLGISGNGNDNEAENDNDNCEKSMGWLYHSFDCFVVPSLSVGVNFERNLHILQTGAFFSQEGPAN